MDMEYNKRATAKPLNTGLDTGAYTFSLTGAKPKKPNEIPVPGKDPEITPTEEPEPGVWPKKEPEIQPEKEPLTIPPTPPREVPDREKII
jgi:hypothetical protein